MNSEYIKSLGMYIPFLIGFVILGAVMMYFNMKNMKKVKNDYLSRYPNAVRVYPKYTNIVVASSKIEIRSVDGEVPARDSSSFFVKPGKSILEVRFESERIGVLHKRVIEYTDTVKVEVNLEEGKEYEIYFDKKEEMFKIKEK